MDGCDFDIIGYLEKCYCTDITSGQSIFGYQHHINEYRNNHNYADYDGINNNNGNNNHIIEYFYLSLLLNAITISYIFYVNSRFCVGSKQTTNNFKKNSMYGSEVESERDAINA